MIGRGAIGGLAVGSTWEWVGRVASSWCVLALSWGTPAGLAFSAPSDDIVEKFQTRVAPILRQFCRDCHGPDLAEGEIDFDRFGEKTREALERDPEFWIRVSDVVETQQMPPRDANGLSGEQRQQLLAWIQEFLEVSAARSAGDPGPVVLRRLSNAQYTYTLRDLTGIPDLEPARDFPVDGAAGEGFTNTGHALVMSPALVTKYFDAAKQVAAHAVLLPEGIEFSPQTTEADWTNEKLAAIRELYSRYTAGESTGEAVNLQGIVFDTNQGGRLPLRPYLQTLFENAAPLSAGEKILAELAAKQHLSPRYLGQLADSLARDDGNPLLQPLRATWARASQGMAIDAPEIEELLTHVQQWQGALFRFTTVGHIGKVGGPSRWLEPVDPLVSQVSLLTELPAATAGGQVEFSLLTVPLIDRGASAGNDLVRWRNPRLTAPGRRDISLREIPAVVERLQRRRRELGERAVDYLAAAAEVQAARVKDSHKSTPAEATTPLDLSAVVRQHHLDSELLEAWLVVLGVADSSAVQVENHLATAIPNSAGYEFVRGWSTRDLPAVLANSSEQEVRVPGRLAPHAVVVHPTPNEEVAVGWQSPLAGIFQLQAAVTHVHPECGNGVTWRLEVRRAERREVLAEGISQGGSPVVLEPIPNLRIHRGDLVALLVGPRDGDHSCDLTELQLQLTLENDPSQTWDLAADVAPDILAGNPHADRRGNANVWHFFAQPVAAAAVAGPALPHGSLLDRWLQATTADVRQDLARRLQALLSGSLPTDESPDAKLYSQLTAWHGPLLGRELLASPALPTGPAAEEKGPAAAESSLLRLWIGSAERAVQFGPASTADSSSAGDLLVPAPAALWVTLPAELAAGYRFAADVALADGTTADSSVQVYTIPGRAAVPSAAQPGEVAARQVAGTWTAALPQAASTRPILVGETSAARPRLEEQLSQFREMFPPALCYAKIVPVDEVVTLTLFYREDDHLRRLMLSAEETAELERLWDALHFVSGDALKLQDAYEQLMEYATQDGDPSVFAPLREPIQQRVAEYEQARRDAEPRHVESVVAFAEQAYRRPLTAAEAGELQELYRQLRGEELGHAEAIRLMLARVLVGPEFLYRLETPPAGAQPGPLGEYELANRLSYFLWSSLPDRELLRAAAAGQLSQGNELERQAQRMLRDPRAGRLAEEFAAYWLHIQNFDEFDEKSEQFFPGFRDLRGSMYEESLRFFDHVLRDDVSILDIVAANYSYLNGPLAAHYGVAGVEGNDWRQVAWPADQPRSGILGQATFLSTQAGASRTSPILRGNWVSEVLLGEKLPKPPKGVPPLPEDPAGRGGLTMRQVVEQHGRDPRCAVCHARIDPFGFALEPFDAIGRWRSQDETGMPLDVAARTRDGYELHGPTGLRDYLLGPRRRDFVRQFCRKLLGFALGRGVQLSDRRLLDEMQQALEANDYRFSAALRPVLDSRQFREIRGQAWEAVGASSTSER